MPDHDDYKPPAAHLSPRRRCVLYLRAAGWDAKRIAKYLGVSQNVVRKDLIVVFNTLVPGLTDGPETAKGYRLVYALGLLDAGVDPKDVPYYMDVLTTRADWLIGIESARSVPVSDLQEVSTKVPW